MNRKHDGESTELDTGDGRLSLKLSGQAKQYLEDIAKARGVTTSAFVKMLVDQGLLIEALLERGIELPPIQGPNGVTYRFVKRGEKPKLMLEDTTGELVWDPKVGKGK